MEPSDKSIETPPTEEEDMELIKYQKQKSIPIVEINEYDEERDEFIETDMSPSKFKQFYGQDYEQKYANPPQITLADLATHNSKLDCWVAVDGKVYNVTPFISIHPGGEKILDYAGQEATKVWHEIHKDMDIPHTIVYYLYEGQLVG